MRGRRGSGWRRALSPHSLCLDPGPFSASVLTATGTARYSRSASVRAGLSGRWPPCTCCFQSGRRLLQPQHSGPAVSVVGLFAAHGAHPPCPLPAQWIPSSGSLRLRCMLLALFPAHAQSVPPLGLLPVCPGPVCTCPSPQNNLPAPGVYLVGGVLTWARTSQAGLRPGHPVSLRGHGIWARGGWGRRGCASQNLKT